MLISHLGRSTRGGVKSSELMRLGERMVSRKQGRNRTVGDRCSCLLQDPPLTPPTPKGSTTSSGEHDFAIPSHCASQEPLGLEEVRPKKLPRRQGMRSTGTRKRGMRPIGWVGRRGAVEAREAEHRGSLARERA